jgi:sugar phosphate isomerase/epimerase
VREKIGINADSFTINGDLRVLETSLQGFVKAGFSHVEIPVHGLDCIVNGSLDRSRVAEAKSILAGFSLDYTVHSPDRLNLADPDYPSVHWETMKATIDFASEIGAEVVVYHGSSCRVGEEETDRLGKVAAHAAVRGVKVAVENIFRQHPDEISYRIDPRNLAAQIAKVDSPFLGICFDFGHAFISAAEEGLPYLEAFKAVLPRLAHVHIHDNFGKPVQSGTKTLDALFLGLGDLHLPPGEGAIPYKTLFPMFSPSYEGVYMMEIQPRFSPRYAEARNWMSRMISGKESRS